MDVQNRDVSGPESGRIFLKKKTKNKTKEELLTLIFKAFIKGYLCRPTCIPLFYACVSLETVLRVLKQHN